MALNPEVLKWFYETQQQLKERFDLDTSRKEDMGRFQVVHLYKKTPDGGKEPLAFGEPVTDLNTIGADTNCATIKRAENGRDYAEPVPENADDRLQWMLDNQRTFQVTENEDGSLTMNSDMSDEELNQLYNEAKDGGLMVRKPDGDIRANNGGGMFLAVDKDGMPVFCDSAFGRMTELSTEQLTGFYENHPELLDKSLQDFDVLMQARIDLTDLHKLEKPQYIYDRMEAAMQSMLGNSMNTDLEETTYQHLAWRQLHEDVVPATLSQYKLSQSIVPSILGRQGVTENIFSGEGLEKFFVVDDQGERPLFPDYEDMKKGLQAGNLRTMAEFNRRLGNAADSNTLAYCGRDPENPEQHKSFRLQKNEDGNFEAKQIPTEKPTLPWYKKVFSIFFRADVARYQENLASYNNFKSMTDYERFFDTMNPTDDMQQKEEPEKKEPNPVKEARKAKLANMTPEQRFKYELAESIKDAYLSRSDNARVYLKMRTTTPEEIQQDPSFQEFMQTESAQNVMAKKLKGEPAFIGILGMDYMKWAAQKAADQQAAAQPGQNVPTVQNPQNAPAQNEAAKNTEAKKPSGPIMGGH